MMPTTNLSRLRTRAHQPRYSRTSGPAPNGEGLAHVHFLAAAAASDEISSSTRTRTEPHPDLAVSVPYDDRGAKPAGFRSEGFYISRGADSVTRNRDGQARHPSALRHAGFARAASSTVPGEIMNCHHLYPCLTEHRSFCNHLVPDSDQGSVSRLFAKEVGSLDQCPQHELSPGSLYIDGEPSCLGRSLLSKTLIPTDPQAQSSILCNNALHLSSHHADRGHG